MSYFHFFEFACMPAPRPRIERGRARRDERYQGWKARVGAEWRQQHGMNVLRAGWDVYWVDITIAGDMRGDLDNYAKSVLDALVSCSAIPDDSVKYLRRLTVVYRGNDRGKSFSVTIGGASNAEEAKGDGEGNA